MNIEEFIDNLNKEISKYLKSNYIGDDFFITTTCNDNTGSEPHAKMLGIISKILFNMNYDIQIERALYNPKRFVPDILAVKDGKDFAIIEYESTNSSDGRVCGDESEWSTCDILNFEKYIKRNNNLPKYWLVITTLPKVKVEKSTWKEWGISRKSPLFLEIINNPFNYYYPLYKKRFDEIDKKLFLKTNLIFINIDRGKANIEFRSDIV